jgi:hypothetical protein
MSCTRLRCFELFPYALKPLLMLQQHCYDDHLKWPGARDHDAGLAMEPGAIEELVEDHLVGFWQKPFKRHLAAALTLDELTEWR